MRFLSLFSGIEAASAAWCPLGWTCVAVAENDKAASRLLKRLHPGVPNLGDVTRITEEDIAALGPINVLIFGSPCQDLSNAGKRKGLAGERSKLFFSAIDIIAWARKNCGLRYALWENVPGAFSTNKGRDFAVVVGRMAGCEDPEPPAHGWGSEGCALGDHGLVEWSVLDAQWFGLAQRRKRVFALLDLGDWRGRPPILLERQSLRGDHPPRRAPRRAPWEGVAGHAAEGPAVGDLSGIGVAHTLKGEGFDASEDGTGRGTPLIATVTGTLPSGGKTAGSATLQDAMSDLLIAFSSKDYGADASEETSPKRRAGGHDGSHANAGVPPAIAFALRGREGGAMPEVSGQVVNTLRGASGGSSRDYLAYSIMPQNSGNQGGDYIVTDWAVRRLTTTECERLQGFEDGHTRIPVRDLKAKPRTKHFAAFRDLYEKNIDGTWTRFTSDGPRYKQIGNSMAVPVIRWIGERIMLADLF